MARYYDDSSYYVVPTSSPSRRATAITLPSYTTTTSRDYRPAYPSSPMPSSTTFTPASQTRYRANAYEPPSPSGSSRVGIDPFLAFHSHVSNLAITYDVSLPPSQIIRTSHSSYGSGISPRDNAIPATSPPLPFLRLECNLLPWPIDIYPADHSTVVTVGDVLSGIYHALRRHVSSSEWHNAPSDTRERIRQSWLRRCKRQQTSRDREYEHSNGLRRIDWLSKDTFFQGLSPGKSRSHWILHLRQGEKTVKFWAGS